MTWRGEGLRDLERGDFSDVEVGDLSDVERGGTSVTWREGTSVTRRGGTSVTWRGGTSVTWRVGDLLHGQQLVFHNTLAEASFLERLFKAQIHGFSRRTDAREGQITTKQRERKYCIHERPKMFWNKSEFDLGQARANNCVYLTQLKHS